MLRKLLLIALAGSMGTVARYWLGGLAARFCGEGFPWGTLVVNGLGCLLFGFVWALAEQRLLISGETRLIILTGFMGAFTTYSTFAFETAQQLRESQWLFAVGNVGLQLLLGLVAIFVGIALGRLP